MMMDDGDDGRRSQEARVGRCSEEIRQNLGTVEAGWAPQVVAAWRNGIASDYESGDCRFDPCGGHYIFGFPTSVN